MTLATLPLLATSPLIRVVCSLIGVLTWQADLQTEGQGEAVLTVVGVGDCLTPPLERSSSRKLTTLELSPKQKNQIILIEGSHTLTSDHDTHPSR